MGRYFGSTSLDLNAYLRQRVRTHTFSCTAASLGYLTRGTGTTLVTPPSVGLTTPSAALATRILVLERSPVLDEILSNMMYTYSNGAKGIWGIHSIYHGFGVSGHFKGGISLMTPYNAGDTAPPWADPPARPYARLVANFVSGKFELESAVGDSTTALTTVVSSAVPIFGADHTLELVWNSNIPSLTAFVDEVQVAQITDIAQLPDWSLNGDSENGACLFVETDGTAGVATSEFAFPTVYNIGDLP